MSTFEFCACAMCGGASKEYQAEPIGADTALLQAAAGDVAPLQAAAKPLYAPNQIVYQVTTNWGGSFTGYTESWVTGTIYYAMPSVSPNNGTGGGNEAAGFNGAMMTPYKHAMAAQAFELWDDLIASSLVETSANTGNIITLAYSGNTTGNGTYCDNNPLGSNASTYVINQSRIWLSSKWDSHDQDADIAYGNYGFITYIHEIGHSLGLSHPGNYSAWEGSFTYDQKAAFAQDTQQYTVMSYFQASAYGGPDHTGSDGIWKYASTPMLYDVLAIQTKYGADMTTRTGDTVYGFGSTAGKAMYDFAVNKDPVLTIWDAGGIDQLNAKGYAQNQVLDLRAGAFSSIGALTQNVAIAFNCTIENAVGGTGSDIIVGNAANNAMWGNAGNDSISGAAGNDTAVGNEGNDVIDGGAGSDLAAFGAARVELDLRTFLGTDGLLHTQVSHLGGAGADGTDTLTAVETVQAGGSLFGLAGAQQNDVSNVTGSRFDDVVFQNETTGQVYAAKMVGGAFAGWSTVTGQMGTGWKAIATGNVNGGITGGAEVFIQNNANGAIYYAGLDSGATAFGVVTNGLTPEWKLKAVADVNGDAFSDAIIQNANNGTIYFANMKLGAFQGWGTVNSALTSDWVVAGAGDFTGDGIADVAVQNKTNGQALYAKMGAGGFEGWGTIAINLTADWKLRAVVNTDGDAYSDAVFQNQSNGTTYVADMNGGSLARWGVVSTALTRDWVVQGSGDFDNDGYGDVLFQNATNGTTYYADMNANGFDHWGSVVSNVNSQWDVV